MIIFVTASVYWTASESTVYLTGNYRRLGPFRNGFFFKRNVFQIFPFFRILDPV